MGFLAVKSLVRGFKVHGFKVHVAVVDPLAVPLVAPTVDIEIAKYDGFISAPNGTGFVRVCVICLAAYKIRLAERHAALWATRGKQRAQAASPRAIQLLLLLWSVLRCPAVPNQGADSNTDPKGCSCKRERRPWQ
jgi:hypothetical protein